MSVPERIYSNRKQAYENLSTKQKRAANQLSNYRLFSFVVGFALAVFLYLTVSSVLGILMGVLTFGFFLYLASQHRQVRAQLRHAEILANLNQKGLERLAGEWVNFKDVGAEFKDDMHPYASDLDLFGQASIFQWINSACSPLGRKALSSTLKNSQHSHGEIAKRQAAITELGEALGWRQRFEAEGAVVADQFQATEPFIQWAEEREEAYLQPMLKLGVTVLPTITCVATAFYLYGGRIPWQMVALLIGTQILLLQLYGKDRSKVLSMVYKHEASLKTYSEMLKLLEKKKFHSDELNRLQSLLRDKEGHSAQCQIQKLSKLVERISNRDNAMFIAINILTLWDYHCLIALEEWKSGSGRLLKTWLEVIAEMEALASLATISFENPQWVMPDIVENSNEKAGNVAWQGLSARKLGHPLLTVKRVANDFTLQEPSGIALITGSNMSGKSTFLRTVGTNLLLAYTGAPVCAEHFRCSIFHLWTCMRVSDNLEQSISSFYAEILRIKEIVEAAKTERSVFFLLDEIFKGTNSHDRHQGAIALIQQLQKDGAMGLVSTHDLELGDLEKKSNSKIINYHFREHYQDNEIFFDYKLREGISTTRNALYLIRLAGIEVNDINQ
ncbi:mismatch repair ATPase (MutS family) [Desulfitobacterium dichloroeliminans LMG P-21439]|uniref:Mismatch repair ATPase (MutS family) n=1 Tax=Desulfitobacterium dichloroeliminans (strain LMG P-21439 / DCA1) TaxID=871963 RepID=L0F7W1_DESDL|nr:MutS family DNA mismatch repair protein [Desulfitobacterium dichloroeliminans]AGA69924.1 mismatch repair ATPase (MutS family) [Desulfitobacterium dichloroeliminans LMG P-21439]